MLKRTIRRFPTLLLILAALAATAVAQPRQTQPQVVVEQWYLVSIQDQPAGWMHVKRTEREGRIISESESRFAIARGTTTIRTQMAGRFIESSDHEPISMWSLQRLGAAPREVEYRFEKDRVAVETREAGRVRQTEMPAPSGEWKTPAAAQKYLAARVAAGAERIVIRQIEPLGDLQPITVTRELLERDAPVRVAGRTITTTKWKVVQDHMPGLDSVEYLDRDSLLVKGTIPLPGLEMRIELSDEATARQRRAAPELMLSTFITPDRSIRRPRQTTRAVFDITVTEGDLPAFPTVGAQTAVMKEDRVRLTISTKDNHPAPAEDLDDPAYLESSQMLEKDDPVIADLTRRALRRIGDDPAREDGLPAREDGLPARQAEAIRAFVYRHVRNKGLDVGFASAGEVARQREGDCTEHAVLAAAMMRAAGIPARVATGLIYADQFAGAESIFGYHMWTQALLDGKWVDYDATLPQRYDATHITIQTSALRDGAFVNDMAAMLPMMGRLKIRVVEVEH